MIGAMTERSATGTERQVVCPFVAFDDDRDYRSSVPDHRHRCFAESPAASRALAHQAAYCLSAAFPSCPTFIDWARREAAPPKDEPIRTVREAPTALRQAERSGESAGRPVTPPAAPATPPRQRRAEWTAPPPWAPDAGGLADAGALAGAGKPVEESFDAAGPGVPSARNVAPAHDDADASSGLGSWSGSALGGLAASGRAADRASGRPGETPADVDREPELGPPEPAAPAFLAGRASRPSQAGATPDDPSRRPVAGRDRDRDRAIERPPDRAVDRGPERAVADPSAPSWERPRRFDSYPSLKSNGVGVAALPRPVLYALIILVVGIALFATPFLLRGLMGGDGGTAASPTPGASASPGASAVASATPASSASATVYTVAANDTLSRIAKQFGVTIDQIVKANPQITNPDKLALGAQLVIPIPVASAITDGAITPAP